MKSISSNACIESFDAKFRGKCLNEHWFTTMAQDRSVIEAYRIVCNTERPDSSLGNLTPDEFARSKNSVSLTADSNNQRDEKGRQIDGVLHLRAQAASIFGGIGRAM